MVFKGFTKNGDFEGIGSKILYLGERYEGEFLKNKKHGDGKLVDPVLNKLIYGRWD